MDCPCSTTRPYKPTPAETEKGLDEVYYEIQQLALMAGFAIEGCIRLNNAALESRLLHARVLIDFFEHTSRFKDDILATDYCFGAEKLAIDPDYEKRLDKDLAHLTYSRTERTLETKPWPHEKVVNPVLEHCVAFIDHVLRSRTTFAVYGPAKWEELRAVVTDRLQRG